MWRDWRQLWINLSLATAFLLVTVPPAAAQSYPSTVKVGLTEPPLVETIRDFGRRTVSFLGLDTFLSYLRGVDVADLLTRSGHLAREKFYQYRWQLRRFCPADCSLPGILRAVWLEIRSWFSRK